MLYRHAKDADARELETPVHVQLHRGDRPRIELIRAAAQKLREASAAKARPLPGARQAPPALAIPPLPAEARRRALDAAIAFLAQSGVLVSVVDRGALVRQYRVSGKRDNKLADEVIAIARERGMPA